MNQYPITFTAENLQKTTRGQKTMTRRLSDVWAKRKVGDLLWIKEVFWEFGRYVKIGTTKARKPVYTFERGADCFCKSYRFDDPGTVVKREELGWHKKSPMFMPKSAARHWLEITELRQERLCDISNLDIEREGGYPAASRSVGGFLQPWFIELWDSINKKPGTRWGDNPMVWVIGYKRIER